MGKSWEEMTDAERRSAAAYGEAAKEKEAGKTPEEKAQERIKAYGEEIDKAKELTTYMEEMAKLGADSLGTHGKILETQELMLKQKEEEYKLRKDVTAEEWKQLIIANKKLKAEKKGYAGAANFWKRMAGIEADPKGVGGFLTNPAGMAEGWLRASKELLSVSRIMASGINKIVESSIALAKAQDDAVVGFKRSTGAGNEYNDNIRILERSMFTYGVTAEEASAAVGALFSNVTDFTIMSEHEQDVLAANVALLNEMGVSMENTTKNMQFFMKVQGQSATQAGDTSRMLFKFAQDLGVSADKLSGDFQKAQGLVASLGDTGVQAFMDLQAQAKATGLEFSTLLKLVKQFDTFESAATQVGKLNALLGGPFLNTLEMVAETDPAERMRKLAEGVNSAGMSYDNMEYYQKKSLAAAMGLNNESELALLMAGKLETARGPVKSQEDIVELYEQTAQFNTVLEEMTQVGMMLAISFGPAIETFKTFLQWIQKAGPVVKLFTPIVAGLAAAMAAMGIAAALVAIAGTAGVAGVGIAMGIGVVTAALVAGSMVLGESMERSSSAFAKGGHPGRGVHSVGENGPETLVVGPNSAAQVHANGSAADTRFRNPSPGAAGGAAPQVNIVAKGDMGGLMEFIEFNFGGHGASSINNSGTKHQDDRFARSALNPAV